MQHNMVCVGARACAGGSSSGQVCVWAHRVCAGRLRTRAKQPHTHVRTSAPWWAAAQGPWHQQHEVNGMCWVRTLLLVGEGLPELYC